MEDRINVHVSEFGYVTVDFFFYKKRRFFVGADYADDTREVLDHIEKIYLPGPNGRRLRRGFAKYRDEIEEAVRSEMNGGVEK